MNKQIEAIKAAEELETIIKEEEAILAELAKVAGGLLAGRLEIMSRWESLPVKIKIGGAWIVLKGGRWQAYKITAQRLGGRDSYETREIASGWREVRNIASLRQIVKAIADELQAKLMVAGKINRAEIRAEIETIKEAQRCK